MIFSRNKKNNENEKIPDILNVRVASVDHLIWKGDASSVSSINSKGPFDILPRHQKFITLVHDSPIQIQATEEKKTFIFPISIIFVSENKVSIFANL